MDNKNESLKGNREGIKDQRIWKLIEECLDIYQEAGYDIEDFKTRWPLNFIQSTGAVNTFGTCSWPQYEGGASYITLNSYMFNESDEAIKSTILHELAHYVNNCSMLDDGIVYFSYGILKGRKGYYNKSMHGSHGSNWKAIASVISNKTGINIQRTDSYSLHTGVGAKAEEKYKYTVTCPECGSTMKYMKKTDFVKNPNISHYDMLVQKYGEYWVSTAYTEEKINKMKNDPYWTCGKCHKGGHFEVKENK